MRTLILLLLATILMLCLVSGVVLNMLIIIVNISGSVALTWQIMCMLYAAAAIVVVGLLWLFVKIGAKK